MLITPEEVMAAKSEILRLCFYKTYMNLNSYEYEEICSFLSNKIPGSVGVTPNYGFVNWPC